jgi:acyl-coenzyme A synthetase/AMP-(fatty) acid ligase
MHSSGTTRAPRRIGMTWAQIDAGADSAATLHGVGRPGSGELHAWIGFTGPESMLGFTLTLAAWRQGAAVAIAPDIPRLIPQIQKLRPRVLGLTPVGLRGLLAELPEDFALQPQLRVVVAGGPLPPAVAREARRRLSPDIRTAYGATEAGSGLATAFAGHLDTHPGAVGYPVPGVAIEIVDGAGCPLPPGRQGHVRIGGPRTAVAYLDDPQASAAAFRDGAFYPGDLGRLTEEGLLIIDGRLDERMNLGGHKFMPALLEDAALECPGILDAAAFAVPDAHGLDDCWLAVVGAEGFAPDTLAAHLARYDGLPPRRFAWIQDIPRNAMGKVERFKLREATQAVLSASGRAAG